MRFHVRFDKLHVRPTDRDDGLVEQPGAIGFLTVDKRSVATASIPKMPIAVFEVDDGMESRTDGISQYDLATRTAAHMHGTSAVELKLASLFRTGSDSEVGHHDSFRIALNQKDSKKLFGEFFEKIVDKCWRACRCYAALVAVPAA
jgi:hypothetical protein